MLTSRCLLNHTIPVYIRSVCSSALGHFSIIYSILFFFWWYLFSTKIPVSSSLFSLLEKSVSLETCSASPQPSCPLYFCYCPLRPRSFLALRMFSFTVFRVVPWLPPRSKSPANHSWFVWSPLFSDTFWIPVLLLPTSGFPQNFSQMPDTLAI